MIISTTDPPERSSSGRNPRRLPGYSKTERSWSPEAPCTRSVRGSRPTVEVPVVKPAQSSKTCCGRAIPIVGNALPDSDALRCIGDPHHQPVGGRGVGKRTQQHASTTEMAVSPYTGASVTIATAGSCDLSSSNTVAPILYQSFHESPVVGGRCRFLVSSFWFWLRVVTPETFNARTETRNKTRLSYLNATIGATSLRAAH